MKTVNPVWNDGNESNDFVLTLPTLGSVQDNDILHFDVWSFAAQDDKLKVSVIDWSVKEYFLKYPELIKFPKDKLKRIQEVRDSRGLGHFIRETLTSGATPGGGSSTAQHKLIGSVEISLKDIPACGWKKWFAIQKQKVSGDRCGGLTSNIS